MDSSSDRSEAVQKLLRLKRYEQPPPRYFNDFSTQVVSRIKAGESRGSWWERFGVDLRPAFAAGAGIFACGLVVYGVATADGDTSALNLDGTLAAGNTFEAAASLVSEAPAALATASTNPVIYGTPIDRKVFGGSSIMPVGFNTR